MAIYSDVITLVSVSTSVNDYGDMESVETSNDVFAEVQSIGQTEFYQAAADGFKPTIKFTLANFADYNGEETVLYTPWGASAAERYSVIRTYRKGDSIELTCQRGVDK